VFDDADHRAIDDVEVDGRLVRGAVGGVDAFSGESRDQARRTLRERNLSEPTADEWYPLPAYLDALAEIEAAADDLVLGDLGERAAHSLQIRAPDPAAALSALDDAYCQRHRGDVGGFAFRQIGDADGRMESHTPYPCAFDRGLAVGVVAAATDCVARVREVGVCRADGSPRCTYDVTW
jgi:hypothetical protein